MTEHLSKTGFEVLAKARELYTQKELGDLIRRSSKQISRWEKSQAVPPELVPALERAIANRAVVRDDQDADRHRRAHRAGGCRRPVARHHVGGADRGAAHPYDDAPDRWERNAAHIV